MYQHIRTSFSAATVIRHLVGDCTSCGSDMVGVSEIEVGKWRIFCTDCEHCAEVSCDERYALREAAHA